MDIKKITSIIFGLLVPSLFIIYIAPFHSINGEKMFMLGRVNSMRQNPGKIFTTTERWNGNVPQDKYFRLTEKILMFFLSFVKEKYIIIVLNVILALLFIAIVKNIYNLTDLTWGYPSGILATVFFITSPLTYFHFFACTIATYIELYFLTGGLYYLIKGKNIKNNRYIYLGFFLSILSVFSKEPALFILPPLIFIIYFSSIRERSEDKVGINKILLALFFLTVCLALLAPFTIRQVAYISRNLKDVLMSASLYFQNYIKIIANSYYGPLLFISCIAIFFKKIPRNRNIGFYTIWAFLAFIPLLLWNFCSERHLINLIVPISIFMGGVVTNIICFRVRKLMPMQRKRLTKTFIFISMIIGLIFITLFNFANFSPSIKDTRKSNIEWKFFWRDLKLKIDSFKRPFKIMLTGNIQNNYSFWQWRLRTLLPAYSSNIEVINLKYDRTILDSIIEEDSLTGNLLKNGSFEDGKAGWEGHSSMISIISTNAIDGAYCASIEKESGPIENYGPFYQSISVEPCQLYFFGGYVKTNKLLVSGRIEVQDINGWHICTGTTNDFLNNTVWTKASGAIMTDKSTKKVIFIPFRIPNYISGIMQTDSLFFIKVKSDRFLMLPDYKSAIYFY